MGGDSITNAMLTVFWVALFCIAVLVTKPRGWQTTVRLDCGFWLALAGMHMMDADHPVIGFAAVCLGVWEMDKARSRAFKKTPRRWVVVGLKTYGYLAILAATLWRFHQRHNQDTCPAPE